MQINKKKQKICSTPDSERWRKIWRTRSAATNLRLKEGKPGDKIVQILQINRHHDTVSAKLLLTLGIGEFDMNLAIQSRGSKRLGKWRTVFHHA